MTHRFLNFSNRGRGEQGSALVYILIAIALLAALTVSFMEPSSQQSTAQNSFKSVTEIEGQVDLIRSAIQECVLSYPMGDNTIVTTGGGATDPGARKNYPINPNSSHLDVGDRSGDRLVRNLRCPGNNPGSPDQNQHTLIFSGVSGKFLPPPPALFEDWQYYNGADGAFFWTETDKTDASVTAALEKLDEKYGECEADIIDTSHPASGDKDLESTNTLACPDGSKCFRIWMLQNASALFPGDVDGDEGGC